MKNNVIEEPTHVYINGKWIRIDPTLTALTDHPYFHEKAAKAKATLEKYPVPEGLFSDAS